MLCRAGEAKNRLGQMRTAGKSAIRCGDNCLGSEAEQIAIGFIRVKHTTNAVGNQRTLRQVIDERLGHVVAGLPRTEMENADSTRE